MRIAKYSLKVILMAVFIGFTAIAVDPVAAFADNETTQAEPVITISDGQTMVDLQDQSSWSRHDLAGGTIIKVANAKDVKGLYIMWDTTVGPWTLRIDGKEYTYGQKDYLHEYVELPASGETVEVVIPDKGMTVCEFWAFTCDTDQLPDWVQVWQPACETADILFIPTHADDEILFFGGALAYYAGELNYKVQVAYFTNHWEERYRPHELLNGLWACGVDNYPVVGPFTDMYSKSLEDAKTLYNNDDCLKYLVELIRRFKPIVVVDHDINGEYGHGVHMLNTYFLMQALEISNDSNYYSDLAAKYGVWDVPKTYLHFYDQNQIVMEWDTPLKNFGGKTAFDVATEAFKFHVSQQKYYKVTRDRTGYGCTQFGLYRSLVGQDVNKNDFFENIDFKKYEPETEPETESVTETVPESVIQPADQSESADNVNNNDKMTNSVNTKLIIFIIIVVAITGIVVVSFMYNKKRTNR